MLLHPLLLLPLCLHLNESRREQHGASITSEQEGTEVVMAVEWVDGGAVVVGEEAQVGQVVHPCGRLDQGRIWQGGR